MSDSIYTGKVKSGFSYLIAPSDAPDSIKKAADLVLDGVTDGTTLNAYIQANKAIDVFETYDQIQLELGPGKIFLDVPLVFDSMMAEIKCAGPEVATNIFLGTNANCDLIQIGIAEGEADNTRVNIIGGHWNGNIDNQGDVIKADIASVTANTFVLVGDLTGTIDVDRPVYNHGSTSRENDEWYTIVSAVFGGGNTIVTVNESIPNDSIDNPGNFHQNTKTWNVKAVAANTITIEGLAAESVIDIDRPIRLARSASMTNDGMYRPTGVDNDGSDTIITVKETISDTGSALKGLITQSPAIIYGKWWKHSQVSGSIFEGSLGSGVLLIGGEQITFNQCTPKINMDCGILVAPIIGHVAEDIRVNDCTITSYRPGSLAGIGVLASQSGGYLSDLWVNDSHIKDCYRYSMLLTGRTENFHIADNHFADCSWQVPGNDSHIRLDNKIDATGQRRGIISGNTFDTDGAYLTHTATAKSCIDMYNSNDSQNYPSGIIVQPNIYTGDQPFITKDSVDAENPCNPNGIDSNPVTVEYMDVLAVDAQGRKAAQAIESSGITFNFSVSEQSDYPRSFTYICNDASGADLTASCLITYMDQNGNILIAPSTGHTAQGVTYESDIAYPYIVSVRVFTVNQAVGDTIDFGFGSKFLLTGILEQNLDDDTDAIVSVNKNKVPMSAPADAVKEYNPDLANGSIDFATQSDDSAGTAINANDDFVVTYKTTSNILVD